MALLLYFDIFKPFFLNFYLLLVRKAYYWLLPSFQITSFHVLSYYIIYCTFFSLDSLEIRRIVVTQEEDYEMSYFLQYFSYFSVSLKKYHYERTQVELDGEKKKEAEVERD